MTRPTLTPAMRAALLAAAQDGRVRGRVSVADLSALVRAGLLSKEDRYFFHVYVPTPAGLDALRAEVST